MSSTQAELQYEGYPTYYAWLRAQYAQKRRLLMDGLTAAGEYLVSITVGRESATLAYATGDSLLHRRRYNVLACAP